MRAAAAAANTLREPVEVDRARLLAAAHDDEGEVHEHVGLGGERVDGLAVEHVALAVLGLAQARASAGSNGAPRHPEHAADVAAAIQRAQERAADLARRDR